jgi:hypothetical protein
MKSNILKIALVALAAACTPQDGEVTLPAVPTASFTAVPSATNPNKIMLTNTSTNGALAKWVFSGAPTKPTAEPVEAYLALQGSYTIKMTAIGKGGTSTTEQVINIAKTDPDGVDPVVLKLTGGVKDGTKTWVWNGAAGSFGVGPATSGFPPTDKEDLSYYSGPANSFFGCVGNDTYAFTLNGEQTFKNNANGTYQWGWAWANYLLGKKQGQYADDCFPSQEPAKTTWAVTYVTKDGLKYPYLKLTDGSNMGYYEGRSEYQILSITNDAMTLRAITGDPDATGKPGSDNWRYFRYVVKK